MSRDRSRDEYKPDEGHYYKDADFFSLRTANCGACGKSLADSEERWTGGHWKSYNGKVVSAAFCSEECINTLPVDNSGCYGPWVRSLGIVPEMPTE